MADEDDDNQEQQGDNSEESLGDSFPEDSDCPPLKCPPCPSGLPPWLATFSDMMTLLLTFFVLLLSFAKTELYKYEAALGSIRSAFGGNVLKHGKVIQMGKSPDNSASMLETDRPIKPYPIEFLTTDGFLDKHEVSRESDEDIRLIKSALINYKLIHNVEMYEQPEGVKVEVNDRIYFKKGSVIPISIKIDVYERLVQLLSNEDWTIYVVGHASSGEISTDKTKDALELSSLRALSVARSLMKRGVRGSKISILFYGDSKSLKDKDNKMSQKVEFVLRRRDFSKKGKKVFK